MSIMDRVRLALGLDTAARNEPTPDRLQHLVAIVNEQSPRWWEAVNESRCQRGEQPLMPSWEELTPVCQNRDSR